jgi:hypothetical protein
MPKFKNLVNFSDSKPLKGAPNYFSHEIYLLQKIKNQKNWYLKCLGRNLTEAFIETIAQEFFRLILPYHPKTRIAIGEDARNYYVLSKEIVNFNANFFLNPQNNKRITGGEITGLAAAQILALLVNEIDFKPCNVGVANGKVIKIDGDLCFARLNDNLKSLLEGKNTAVTRADIEALPDLDGYGASNWLNLWDSKKKRVIKIFSTQEIQTINQMPNFKRELYQTILRIISLPDALIRFFTQSYATDEESYNYKNSIRNKLTVLANALIARKKQLAQAAYQISAFNDYRFSNEAHEEILAYLQQLKKFKTIGSSILLADFKEKFNFNIEETIFEKQIKAYPLIKQFFRKLRSHQTRLNKSLSIESLLLIRTEDRKRIIKYLEEVKPIFNQYLNLPKMSHFNELNSTLHRMRKTLNGLFPSCLFIQEIDILLRQLEPPSATSNPNQHSNSSPFFHRRKLPTLETNFPNKKFIPDYYVH